jgi:hypothetical protein
MSATPTMIKCFAIKDCAHASEVDGSKNMNAFEVMMTAELNRIVAFPEGKQCRQPRLYIGRYQVDDFHNS